jgi:hypothetical protein
MTTSDHSISFLSEENVLKLIVIVVLVVQLCEHIKIHWIVHFKWVNSVICILYLKKLFSKNML